MDRLEALAGGVRLGSGGVAASQLEAGGGLPGLGKPVDVVEPVGRGGVAPMGEHAASAHGGQLVRVADANQPPGLRVGQADEPGEVVGGRHRRLIQDDRRARRRARRSSGVGVALEEARQGDGRTAGLAGQHIGSLARWRQPHHWALPGP